MRSSKSLIALSLVALFALTIVYSYASASSSEQTTAVSSSSARETAMGAKVAFFKSERQKVSDITQEVVMGSARTEDVKKLAKEVKRKHAANLQRQRNITSRAGSSSSRGGRGSFAVEPVVREVGATYWASQEELDALVWIVKHECTTPGTVARGKYHGLFQLRYPPSWMVLGDAASETHAGCQYIKRRYGTPLKAKAFWQSRGWY